MKINVGKYLIAKDDVYMYGEKRFDNRCLSKNYQYKILQMDDTYIYINSDFKLKHAWTIHTLDNYFNLYFNLNNIKIL